MSGNLDSILRGLTKTIEQIDEDSTPLHRRIRSAWERHATLAYPLTGGPGRQPSDDLTIRYDDLSYSITTGDIGPDDAEAALLEIRDIQAQAQWEAHNSTPYRPADDDTEYWDIDEGVDAN